MSTKLVAHNLVDELDQHMDMLYKQFYKPGTVAYEETWRKAGVCMGKLKLLVQQLPDWPSSNTH
jgi:hypothetical protein